MKTIILGLFVALCSLSLCARANAQQQAEIVPRVTIYPGTIIDEGMLRQGSPSDDVRDGGLTRTDVIGRIARTTLLAGRSIPREGIDDLRSIRNGAAVRLVYSQRGLVIDSSGLALQGGRVGDAIRVRNTDSGIVVIGVIGVDGSIKVDQ